MANEPWLEHGPVKSAAVIFEGTQDLSAAITTPVRLGDLSIDRITDLIIYSLVGDGTLHFGSPTGPTVTLSKLASISAGISGMEVTGGIWITTAGSAGGSLSYLMLGR